MPRSELRRGSRASLDEAARILSLLLLQRPPHQPGPIRRLAWSPRHPQTPAIREAED